MLPIFDVQAAQRLGAALLYAPREITDPLENLGSVVLPNGSLKNGTALVVPGIAKGYAAAQLDGSNDYIDTGWVTRTNLCTNPFAGAGTTAKWAIVNTPTKLEAVTFAAKGVPNLVLPNGEEIKTGLRFTGDSDSDGAELWISVVKDKTYCLSAYLHPDALTGSMRAQLRAYSSTYGFYASSAEVFTTKAWARVSLTFKAASTETAKIIPLSPGVGTSDIYFTAVLAEETNELREYGPTPGQLSSGLAGWSGAAHESASDIGPFARGTARTFVWASKRTDISAFHSVFSGPNPYPYFTYNTGGDDAAFDIDSTDGSPIAYKIWAGAGPAAGVAGVSALTFSDPLDTAELFVNGVSQGAQTGMTKQFGRTGSESMKLGVIGAATFPFKGLLLPFAVFTRALSAPEIESLRPTRLSVTGEKPPMRQYIMATTPGGSVHRWGEDERLADNAISDLQDSDTVPGGFRELSVSLSRKPGIDYSDMVPGTKLELFGAGRYKCWEGRLERAPRTTGDRLVMDPSAAGYQVHLADNETAQAIPIDADMSAFGEPSARRKDQMKAHKVNQNAQVALLPAGDPNGGSVPALSHSWATINSNIGALDIAESVYDSAGVELGMVTIGEFLNIKGGGGSSWVTNLLAASDDILTAFEVLKDFNATNGSGTFSIAAGRFFLTAQSYFSGKTEAQGNWEDQYRGLVVFDRSGIPIYGAWPLLGILASDFVAYAVGKWAPQLRFTTGPRGSIRPSSFQIPHLTFKETTTVKDMIEKASRFELPEWAVWDGPKGPTFYMNERGQREGRKRWRARVGPAQLKEAGQQMDHVWNGVAVQFEDFDGSVRIIGPPGSSVRQTDSRLIDTDPLNPANRAGIKKYTKIKMRRKSNSSGAIKTGQRFLEQTKLLDGSGEATLTGYVEDENRVPWPYYCVRSGDVIDFIDSSVPGDRYIVSAQRSRSERSVSIQLDAPPDSIEALLERLDVEYEARGID